MPVCANNKRHGKLLTLLLFANDAFNLGKAHGTGNCTTVQISNQWTGILLLLLLLLLRWFLRLAAHHAKPIPVG